MFIFSWRGLGFLVPAIMGAPFFIVYGALKLAGDPESMNPWYVAMGLASIVSPMATYFIGSALNKKQIYHMFCEIRFEHWAIILAAMELIVALGLGSMFAQEYGWGNSLEGIFFWTFMVSVFVVPIATAIFIRKYKRLDAKEI